jgi:hypothetical protein
MIEIENAINELHKLKKYSEILRNPDEFFHHMQGHRTELSMVLSAFDIAIMSETIIKSLKMLQNNNWVPVTERMPDNETEVDVTVERRYDDKIHTFTCRAVYEDGTMWSDDSMFCWDNFDNMEYDEEKDDYLVPEGWFESVSYLEESHIIDDFVIAWKPVSNPWNKTDKERIKH